MPHSDPYQRIHDPDDPRIAAYRSLKGKALERSGIFIAEGEKVVRSLVAGDCPVVSCLASRDAMARHRPLLRKIRGEGGAVYLAPPAVIERIIGFRFHRGIMAVGRCPPKRSLTEALPRARERRLFVALNGVNDPQNVGLIARSAAAFGVDALIVDRESYDPYYRKAVRVSMGTIFELPIYYEDDLAASLRCLRKAHGVRILATSIQRGAMDIARAKASGSTCFIFGNEDAGVSSRVARASDGKVRIPIAKKIDSLNVASAAAICLYTASRENIIRIK